MLTNKKLKDMKNNLLPVALVVVAMGLLSSSCKKHDMADMDHTMPVEKNINYHAAYIVNGAGNNLSVMDLASSTVKETIDLSGATFPHHIYMSPDKSLLAVAITSTDLTAGHGGGHGGSGGFKVMIIDPIKGTIHHEIPLSKLPHNAVFSPSGEELWLGQSDSTHSTVEVYRVSDYSLVKSIPVGAGLSEITFSTDGSKVFAANTMDANVSVIDPHSKMVEKTIPVGQDPVGAWPASNGHMYVDNETDQTISEIAVSSLTVVSTTHLGFKPGYAAYNHHLGELWVSDATHGKVVFYTNQGGTWTLAGDITTGADAHAIVFTADGTKAYVSNQGANSVSIVDVASHSVLSTVNVGAKPNGLVLRQ